MPTSKSRVEMLTNSSNSPKKFLQIQSESQWGDSSIISDRRTPSNMYNYNTAKHKEEMTSHMSPNLASLKLKHQNAKMDATTVEALLNARVSSALGGHKGHRKNQFSKAELSAKQNSKYIFENNLVL